MTDVFGDDPTKPGQEPTPTSDANEDLLKQIVNEEGVQKYANITEALKGAKEGQEFIQKLKEENATVRAEVDKRMSMEQVLTELKAAGTKPDETPSPVDPEAIQDLVDKRLEARTTEQTEAVNETTVQDAILDHFGEKGTEIVQAKARELGMSKEALRELSKRSPQAGGSMFGLASTKQESVPTPAKGTVRTDSLDPVSGNRTYAYYTKMRKEHPSEYRNQYPQMLRDAEAQGEDFYK